MGLLLIQIYNNILNVQIVSNSAFVRKKR